MPHSEFGGIWWTGLTLWALAGRWRDIRNNHHRIGEGEGQHIQFECGIMYLLPQLFCRVDSSNLCRMHRHLSSNAPGMRQAMLRACVKQCSRHMSSNASAMPRHAKSKSEPESQLNKTSSRPTITFKAQILDELTSLEPATRLPPETQRSRRNNDDELCSCCG